MPLKVRFRTKKMPRTTTSTAFSIDESPSKAAMLFEKLDVNSVVVLFTISH
jgi:hypothetical protein